MNPDELFDRFPELVLSSFRTQMLLGKVPAETVLRVLKPLLSNYFELMLQLPPSLQTDFENILRIYPDVAERFDMRIKPPIVESLGHFARYRLRHGSPDSVITPEFDVAAEPQQELNAARGPFINEGQGFFVTDKGNAVYLEFFYAEKDDCASFVYKPAKLEIEVQICGIFLATLSPGKPRCRISVDDLFEVLAKCIRQAEIKLIEHDI
jgi:hypothetical protein